MKKIRIVIEKWAHGGFSLAHVEGRPIFITGGIPGEEVDITIEKEEKKVSFAKVTDILKKDKIRTESDCNLFGECGGCSYRHLPYQEELNLKKKLLLELFPDVKGELEVLSGSPVKYRNNVQWQMDGGQIGFYGRFSHNLLPVETGCPNLPDILQPKLWQDKFQNRKDKKQKRELRVSDPSGTDLAKNQKAKPAVLNSERETTHVRVGEMVFSIPPTGFFQINTGLILPWLNQIKEYIGTADSCLELFCGVGLIGLGLGIPWKRYQGYEINQQAIEFAKRNADEMRRTRMEFVTKDLYSQNLPKEAMTIGTWIVNPPRSGLNDRIIAQMESARPKKIIYSSCNPQTLKRDISLLMKKGYESARMCLVDFFPRTHHYEVLVDLRLEL
ncbi:MAG: methyltransferase [Leptospira sp.]|nr:methyltransferase [Leptospira sp.]